MIWFCFSTNKGVRGGQNEIMEVGEVRVIKRRGVEGGGDVLCV